MLMLSFFLLLLILSVFISSLQTQKCRCRQPSEISKWQRVSLWFYDPGNHSDLVSNSGGGQEETTESQKGR